MQNRKADNMKEIKQEFLTGERALFQGHDLRITDTIFDDGESPLKESRNIELYGSMFKWKYPLWYSENITVKNCTWFEMARAGVWYCKPQHSLLYIYVPKGTPCVYVDLISDMGENELLFAPNIKLKILSNCLFGKYIECVVINE